MVIEELDLDPVDSPRKDKGIVLEEACVNLESLCVATPKRKSDFQSDSSIGGGEERKAGRSKALRFWKKNARKKSQIEHSHNVRRNLDFHEAEESGLPMPPLSTEATFLEL